MDTNSPGPPALMTIASEIRLQIYKHVFDEITVYKRRLVIEEDIEDQWDDKFYASRGPVVPKDRLALLCVSKTIYQEAKAIASSCPVSYVVQDDDPTGSWIPLHHPRSCPFLNRIRSIKGDMSHRHLARALESYNEDVCPALRLIDFTVFETSERLRRYGFPAPGSAGSWIRNSTRQRTSTTIFRVNCSTCSRDIGGEGTRTSGPP